MDKDRVLSFVIGLLSGSLVGAAVVILGGAFLAKVLLAMFTIGETLGIIGLIILCVLFALLLVKMAGAF